MERLENHIIEAQIISGRIIGDKVFIPKMILTNSHQTLPNQCQSLSTVSVYLHRPVFTHEQLYIAVSRFKSKKELKIRVLVIMKNLLSIQPMLFTKKYSKICN
ncbi:hypothetical protein ACS0TY_033660 [Phlomoides rotata]